MKKKSPTLEQITDVLRSHLVDTISGIDGPIICLLSAGIDSHALLFACLEAGRKDITAMSFMLDGKLSTDFVYAKRTCRKFDIPFKPIFLPTDMATLEDDVKTLACLGCQKKTDFECGWPLMYVSKQTSGARSVLSGYRCDSYFGLSRKAAVAGCQIDVKALDEYRRASFSVMPTQQMKLFQNLLGESCRVYYPYADKKIQKIFAGVPWVRINRPKQKQPIRNMFPEYLRKTRVGLHSNYQLGDSGIAKHFENLIASTKMNPNGMFKSVKGVYNTAVRSWSRMSRMLEKDSALMQSVCAKHNRGEKILI